MQQWLCNKTLRPGLKIARLYSWPSCCELWVCLGLESDHISHKFEDKVIE